MRDRPQPRSALVGLQIGDDVVVASLGSDCREHRCSLDDVERLEAGSREESIKRAGLVGKRPIQARARSDEQQGSIDLQEMAKLLLALVSEGIENLIQVLDEDDYWAALVRSAA